MHRDIPLYVDGRKVSRREWKAAHALHLHRRYVWKFERAHAERDDHRIALNLRRAQHWLDRYHLLMGARRG